MSAKRCQAPIDLSYLDVLDCQMLGEGVLDLGDFAVAQQASCFIAPASTLSPVSRATAQLQVLHALPVRKRRAVHFVEQAADVGRRLALEEQRRVCAPELQVARGVALAGRCFRPQAEVGVLPPVVV